jgi:NAD(P)-dependent dehydrogenase (short-subunit alcohol dehydrogenase family)
VNKLLESQSLKGKVVIVTGGSAGCGWGFTYACAQAGADVIVADLNPLSDERIALVEAQGVVVNYIQTDVSDPGSIERTVSSVIEQHGTIDGLINNAGLTLIGDFLEFELDVINRLFDTNLRSVLLMCQAVARHMRERGSGAIVNISSNHALASTADYEMYAATKGGILAMTRAMSWSLGKYGIRANTLCAGLTRTEPIDAMAKNDPALEQAFNSMHATNSFNSVEQLGAVGVFLLSDASASMTGSEIVADQGLLASLCNADVIT